MNQASDMIVIQLWFFGKKLLFLEKNLKIDNFLYSIKNKTRKNKELKYRQKNSLCRSTKAQEPSLLCLTHTYVLEKRDFKII